MKYQWLDEDKSCQDLEELLGCRVKSINKGWITVGYEERKDDITGDMIRTPIKKRGIEIELEGETKDDLDKIDLLLNQRRKGGRTLREAIEANIDLSLTNPQKQAYKLSQFYGLAQSQLENYIDNNVTNLAEAKAFLKKLSAVVLYLVKQTKLDK